MTPEAFAAIKEKYANADRTSRYWAHIYNTVTELIVEVELLGTIINKLDADNVKLRAEVAYLKHEALGL